MNFTLVLLLLLLGRFPYREALPGGRYEFPRDHFEHEDYRTEWWYYTGNVKDGRGKHYGFELVFFRQGVRGERARNDSAWRIDDVYLAHAAVTRIDKNEFRYEERLNRAGPGIAGASYEKQRVWNGNWQTKWNGERQTLSVVAEDFRFQLDLQPAKSFVIHGVNGVSQKAEGVGRASHYVSFPRLAVIGRLDGEHVEGTAWMDHEWFTQQLDAGQNGWDWFSAQFDDGTELMLFELRRADSIKDSYSAGTFVDKAGTPHHLMVSDFEVQPTDYWVSPKNSARYPIAWRVRVPADRIDVTCRAAIPDQELVASKGGTTYWEGAVIYTGTQRGRGYLEMTGYDKPVSFR